MNSVKEKINQQIEQSNAIDLLRNLINIPSSDPPGDTRTIADFLAKALRAKGIRADLFSSDPTRVSVVGRLKGKGGGKSILFLGHLDTVPIGDSEQWSINPLGGECHKGKIYGRGSSDCKGGVAAMILAAEALLKASVPLRGDIILAMAAGEETLSEMGTAFLLNKGVITADAAIVTEPTTLPAELPVNPHLQIFIASRGMIIFEITTEGKAVHAKIAHQGVNAIAKMSEIILALQNLKLDHIRHPFCGTPSLNIGLIDGGTSSQIVPDRCRIILNRNTVPGEDLSSAVDQVTATLDDLMAKDNFLKAKARILTREDPVEVSPTEPIVTILNEAIESALGRKAGIGGMIGTNDSRFLIRQGIPSVICGPGITTQSHGIDEYVEVESVRNAAKIYALAAARYCSYNGSIYPENAFPFKRRRE